MSMVILWALLLRCIFIWTENKCVCSLSMFWYSGFLLVLLYVVEALSSQGFILESFHNQNHTSRHLEMYCGTTCIAHELIYGFVLHMSNAERMGRTPRMSCIRETSALSLKSVNGGISHRRTSPIMVKRNTF